MIPSRNRRRRRGARSAEWAPSAPAPVAVQGSAICRQRGSGLLAALWAAQLAAGWCGKSYCFEYQQGRTGTTFSQAGTIFLLNPVLTFLQRVHCLSTPVALYFPQKNVVVALSTFNIHTAITIFHHLYRSIALPFSSKPAPANRL